jgi:hypothetical protein
MPNSGPGRPGQAASDGTRASFCLALLDGRAWTATELARHAGVAGELPAIGGQGDPVRAGAQERGAGGVFEQADLAVQGRA